MTQARKKVAVILSGCGFRDGSEIHEAVCTLLALSQQGADYACFAPDIPQARVANHITDADMPESRNVLVESARIARGAIEPLSALDVSHFDALILPGGFGAAVNLCDFGKAGADCTVQPQVQRVLQAAHRAGKPIGALCIAPVILAKLFPGAKLTIGDDEKTAAAIEKMGAQHEPTTHGQIVVDERLKLVTTPCYMLNATVAQIYDGASALVKAVLQMA